MCLHLDAPDVHRARVRRGRDGARVVEVARVDDLARLRRVRRERARVRVALEPDRAPHLGRAVGRRGREERLVLRDGDPVDRRAVLAQRRDDDARLGLRLPLSARDLASEQKRRTACVACRKAWEVCSPPLRGIGVHLPPLEPEDRPTAVVTAAPRPARAVATATSK